LEVVAAIAPDAIPLKPDRSPIVDLSQGKQDDTHIVTPVIQGLDQPRPVGPGYTRIGAVDRDHGQLRPSALDQAGDLWFGSCGEGVAEVEGHAKIVAVDQFGHAQGIGESLGPLAHMGINGHLEVPLARFIGQPAKLGDDRFGA
jgi:hypothetical protein